MKLYINCDSAEKWQVLFQDPATPIMEGITQLHHAIMGVLIVIAIFVSYILAKAIMLFNEHNNPSSIDFKHNTTLEIVWTIIPTIILVAIGLPSFSLLYAMDEIMDPSVTIKAVGHQWYWSYEYSDYFDIANIKFDSYMVDETDLSEGQFRLLEVDNRTVLPVNTHIRIVVTSEDVIHSWAVPSLGVKVDAIPGRLNQIGIFIKREGVFYGQCSEICGANHGFMPIVVHAVSKDNYLQWVQAQLSKA